MHFEASHTSFWWVFSTSFVIFFPMEYLSTFVISKGHLSEVNHQSKLSPLLLWWAVAGAVPINSSVFCNAFIFWPKRSHFLVIITETLVEFLALHCLHIYFFLSHQKPISECYEGLYQSQFFISKSAFNFTLHIVLDTLYSLWAAEMHFLVMG